MRKLIRLSQRLVNDPSGTTAMEYGLIAGLISLAVVTGATTTGQIVNSIYSAIGSQLVAALAGIGG